MPAIDQVTKGMVLDGAEVKVLMNSIVWQWYHQHQDDVIKKIWFFTVHVRDLHVVFEALVGPEGP